MLRFGGESGVRSTPVLPLGHCAGVAHQVSTVSSSITGAICLTVRAEPRATAGRTPAAGAKAEHEPRTARTTNSFMGT